MAMPDVETLAELTDLTIPLYASIALGKLRAKTGEFFTIVAGLTEDLAAQLKARALDQSDTELQSKTSDHERFGLNSYEEWYSQGRVPFALVDGAQQLAALIWFGPKPVPTDSEQTITDISGDWDTTALRSYIPHRGKGLMRPFFNFAWNAYHRLAPERRLWMQTNQDNVQVLALTEKLGFVNYGRRAENGRILLVKS
ncbi:MAG: hypothetical protein JO019_04720 [Candidatus Kaiserbacteria bacterium]|nr:hypothetical protein [Candidatus Kaiserbacteria bacterium]